MYFGIAALYFAFDALMIALFVIFNDKTLFNLDAEHNFPTMLQALKSGFLGGICLLIPALLWLRNKLTRRDLLIWIPLSLAFIFMSLDETAQFHEHTSLYLNEFFPGQTESYRQFFGLFGYNSTDWLLYYIPVIFIGLVGLFFIVRALVVRYGIKLWLPALLSIPSFAAVILFEVISTGNFLSANYRTYVLWEELGELWAISLWSITLGSIAAIELKPIMQQLKTPAIKVSQLQLKRCAMLSVVSTLLFAIYFTLYQVIILPLTNPWTETARIPPRSAGDGCFWDDQYIHDLRIQVYVEQCAEGVSVLSTSSALYLVHNSTTHLPIQSFKTLEIFDKSDQESIKSAINRVIIQSLPPADQAACVLIHDPQHSVGDAQAFKIIPRVDDSEPQLPGTPSCGPYSISESGGYLLYSASNNKWRFLFVHPSPTLEYLDLTTVQIR